MRKLGKDLRIGDVIEVGWKRNDRIIRLTPYQGPLLSVLGKGTQLAEFAVSRVGMTLPAGELFVVF